MDKDFHLQKNFFKEPLRFDGINVSQIGRLFCNSETVIDTHIHTDLFELTVVTDGKGEITTNGIPVLVERGDIYLSLPCDSHRIASDADKPLKFDFFAFTCDQENYCQDLERIVQTCHFATTRIFHDDNIRLLISNAIAELNHENIYSRDILASIFRQILIYVIRGFKDVVPEKSSDTVTGAEKLCYNLMNYIDTHIYSLKKLEELAGITDYSYGYLSAVFKKTTSNTLFNYYHEKKLDAARLLLSEKKYKITEIAELLNYTSVYAFSKAFTKHYGVSPRNFQNSPTPTAASAAPDSDGRC